LCVLLVGEIAEIDQDRRNLGRLEHSQIGLAIGIFAHFA
jgi:hypothetical protein